MSLSTLKPTFTIGVINCLKHTNNRIPFTKLKCFNCITSTKNEKDSFISRAMNQYSNYQYDYSNILYLMRRIQIYCPHHKLSFYCHPLQHLDNNYICKLCTIDNNNKTKANNYHLFLCEAINKYGNKFDYDEKTYKANNVRMIFKCNIHQRNFSQTPEQHLVQPNCRLCLHEKRVRDKQNDFITACIAKYDILYDYSKVVLINLTTPITIICNTCQQQFNVIPREHLVTGKGCNKCFPEKKVMSKGEKIICNYLVKNHYQYEYQKRFKNCRNFLPLPFDFYLPDLNLLIEFDGQQHFKSSVKFGGLVGFRRTLMHDAMKNEYAKKMGIELLRIKYNERIENKLEKHIMELLKKMYENENIKQII